MWINNNFCSFGFSIISGEKSWFKIRIILEAEFGENFLKIADEASFLWNWTEK